MSLDDIIEQLGKNNESFTHIFQRDDKNIQRIISTKNGETKLRSIAGISDFLFKNGFNSYHYFSIVVGKGWEEKLEWIAANYEALLKPMEFNGSHVSQIVRNKGWEEKLEWIAANYEALLKPMEFNGYHVSQIVVGKGWEEKLEWIAANYEALLKPMEFNGSHVSQIVRNKGWEEKLEWIAANYEALLKPMEFNGYHVSQIVVGKGWEEKLEWIAQHYVFFKENGLSNNKLALSLRTKDWQSTTERWSEHKDLFDMIRIDDERISPLVEGYLRNSIFKGKGRETVFALIQKCTYEEIDRFERNVYAVSGIQIVASVDAILAELNRKFGYSKEEVNIYLVAINKNKRGLLSWYNYGQKTKQYEVSLDSPTSEEDDTSLLDKIPEKERTLLEIMEKDSINKVYQHIINFDPEHERIWQRFIFDYSCDMENLKPEEIGEFNNALKELRSSKSLLEEVYDLLT